MSNHQAPAVQSVPSSGNLAQPIPQSLPQDWYAVTERMRRERPPAPVLPDDYFAVQDSDIAMTFTEIAARLGCTPQQVQYIFNRAMRKLARMRQGKFLQDLYGLAQLRESMARQRELVMDDTE